MYIMGKHSDVVVVVVVGVVVVVVVVVVVRNLPLSIYICS